MTNLKPRVEMIGARKIDVLVLPDMSRAELARRVKKTDNSHCPVLRLLGASIRRSSTVATLEGKILVHYEIQLISGQQHLWTLPC